MSDKDPGSSPESVALLIQHTVKKGAIERYEKWLPAITAVAAKQPGHQGVDVIRPSSGGNQYTIVIRYASLAAAESWTRSETRKRLIDEVSDAFEDADRPEIRPGIEFWFTPPAVGQKHPRGWKQWLVTTSVIWPLTVIVPPLYKPVFAQVPLLATRGVREGIIAATVVAIVVFVVMPRYVRAVSAWLYK